jgi:hypothetical protein
VLGLVGFAAAARMRGRIDDAIAHPQ